MKNKKMIIVLIIFAIFLCSVFAGKFLYDNYEINEQINSELNSNTTEESQIKNSHIIERNEISTMALFELEPGLSYYEVDLVANDMTWNHNTRLYYKIITNTEDYNKYKERINLPERTDADFKDSFVVILVNENIRNQDEIDLMVYDVIADETTTHIIMKQKENPSYYSENNVFYAIVDISELRENVTVVIE